MDYDALAPVYERVFGPEAADDTWRALAPLVLPSLAPRARVLELCCGTGEITRRLLDAGCRVTAVDRSRAMLAYARRRAPKATFIAADLRTYHPAAGQFAAVVCAYNSLPHITRARELEMILRRVQRALLPEGCFVFDLYPEESFAAGWHGVHRAEACVLEASYRPRTGRAVTHVYWAGGSAALRIRAYAQAELEQMLGRAGLRCERRIAGAGRVFWCCGPTAEARRRVGALQDGSRRGCGGRRTSLRSDRSR